MAVETFDFIIVGGIVPLKRRSYQTVTNLFGQEARQAVR